MASANFDDHPEFLRKLDATQSAIEKAAQQAESARSADARAERDRAEKLTMLMRRAEETLRIAAAVAALAGNKVHREISLLRGAKSFFGRPTTILSGWRIFSETKGHSSYGLGISGRYWKETSDIILSPDGSLYRCHYEGEPHDEVFVRDGLEFFSQLQPETVTAWGYWAYERLGQSLVTMVLDNGRLSGEAVLFNPPGVPLPTGPARGIAEVQDGLARFVITNKLKK